MRRKIRERLTKDEYYRQRDAKFGPPVYREPKPEQQPPQPNESKTIGTLIVPSPAQ